jgi:iron complex outermembrane recepter protein
MTIRMPLVPAVVLLALAFTVPALAQSEGRLTGAVRDATGAGMSGVTVTATNQATNQTRTTTTGADGTYALSLPPGTYAVSIALPDFRKVSQTVQIASPPASLKPLDFTLEAQLSEEITVTATKREQTLLEVPFSVAAPTEELLRTRGVENIEGIAANVSGLTVQNLGPGQSQVAMRGVSAGQIVRDQPGVKEQVGVYLDESVISLSLFTPDLDLFDTQRVEVLRGPQGTLFGSGSLTGTVRYITNPPKLGTTERFAELGLNVAGGGSLGGTAKFGANVPLGEKAALRLATYFGRVPGFMDAVQPDLSVTDDVNDGFRAGLRVASLFAPSAQTTIAPRVVYQRVRMDGWNRIDAFNILANPFTTTRPAVTLGERQQFTQLQEDFTDDFMLADVQINHQVGGLTLTSVTSYTFRDVLVVRDAGALTSSITGGTIGLPENVYTLDAPLNDATTANVWTQELRVSSNTDRFPWLAGLFYSHTDRQYGQDLPVLGFESLTGIPTQGLRAPRDTLFFSDLDYNTNQFALFGEATAEITPKFSLTGGLRFYHFSEDKDQVFDGLFANDNTGMSLVSQPGSTDANGVAPRVIAMYKLTNDTNVNAQLSRGFRLGGINDPLNEPLCTPADLVTFGGRETWLDEKVWNYEGGIKSRVPGVSGSVGASFFYMDISDLQATVTAGSCSSRVVFNVPKARSTGFEVEFEAAPTRNFDFAVSANFTDAELRSTLTSTDTSGNVSVVSGIEEGRRLPTVPRFQFVGAATYQWEVRSGGLAYVTGSYQHIGSRFTQVGDEDLGRLDLLSFGANTIGAPLTQSVFVYDPKLPAYDLLNLRAGLRRNTWDVSVFINNVTDERALLSLDQERNTRARIGYLTNQPRTIGVSTRFDF